MKRSTLVFISLLVYARLYSQDALAWDSATKLTWGDFQSKADVNSPFSALTVSGIVYKFSLSGDGYSDSIKAVFYRAESWVRVRSGMGLIHEQGHFDISEVFARTLRKRLREFVPRRGSLGQQLRQLYEEVEKDRESMEKLYDSETDHSANAARQAYWNGKIRDRLKELEEYGN